MAALTLGACSKSDLNGDYISITELAQVEIVHASAGTGPLDIAFDNNRLGVSTFNFTDRVDYLRATPGNRNFKVFLASSSSGTPFFDKDIQMDQDRHYTIFIADTASKMDAVVIRDSSRAAGNDSVRIRFANISPDAPALDLYVKGDPTPVATNITYKSAGDFLSYKSGLNVVFEIRKTGESEVIATSDPYALVNSKIYTIWSAGYVNGNAAAGTNLRVSRFSHNPLYY